MKYKVKIVACTLRERVVEVDADSELEAQDEARDVAESEDEWNDIQTTVVGCAEIQEIG